MSRVNHLKVINIDINKILVGVSLKKRSWWNWEAYLETWRMYDENPKTTLAKYPFYQISLRNSKRLGRPDPQAWAKMMMKQSLSLYQDIKKNGYVSEKSRNKPITGDILKGGRIWLINGHRRVSIMRHLGHPKKINVVVRERRKGWLTLKQSAFNIYRKQRLYQPIDHPDFADWSVGHRSQDRLTKILNDYGDVSGKEVLDIGSCTGYFSIQLAKRGAKVVGSEINKTRLSISKTMANYHGLGSDNLEFIGADYKKYLAKSKKKFDFILFLNLLHHYLKKNVKVSWSIVNMLSKHTDIMYLGIGELKLLIKPKLVPQAIIDNSDFTSYSLLLRTEDKRPFYVFRKRETSDFKGGSLV